MARRKRYSPPARDHCAAVFPWTAEANLRGCLPSTHAVVATLVRKPSATSKFCEGKRPHVRLKGQILHLYFCSCVHVYARGCIYVRFWTYACMRISIRIAYVCMYAYLCVC